MKTIDFKNLMQFIDFIKSKNNIYEIINKFESHQDKGHVFERLFDLVIKFGYCDIFRPNNNFKHIISNINNGIIDYLKNLQDYLTKNKISNGNSCGVSDITLYDNENEEYIFISSKYPKSNDDITKSKSVDYYDIQNIIAVIDNNKYLYENYKTYLLVPNKKKVLDKVKNANKSSKYITKYMTEENILDEEDLNKYFLELKKDLLKYDFMDYNNVFMKKKEKLKTRFHQKLINKKTSDLIEDSEKQILWGLKCRSGKTYCCADLIKSYGEKNLINVLIMTPAPSETTPQFEEVFNNYMGFENFDIHSIKSGKDLLNIEINKEKSNIFIASKQLLQNYTGENTIEKIKNLKFIFSDENHHATTTNLAKQIFESYSSKKTVKIYLTATYNKPLKEWGIPENCQMYWDIEDEQICKAIYKSIEMKNYHFSSEQKRKSIYNDEKEIIKLVDKHSNMVNEVIEEYKKDGYSIKDIFKSYLSMPDLYLLSSIFDQERYNNIKEKISDSEYGFSFDSLLSLNTSKTKFRFENEVGLFLRYISGSNKEKDFKKKDKSIFSRINNICSDKESRLPLTQIWFLPPNNINETSKALIKVVEKDSILSQYDFYPINSKNNNLEASKIKQLINNFELKAKKENKKGLILLAGNMLSLGITLSNCDVVMLFNNTLSSDKVMQQMYRAMTEDENKKFGFVVDLNISRVLNTCINYSIYKKDLNTEDKLKYMFDYHLMNIDVDMWENKKLNSDYLVNKLLDIWKNDPINNLKTMLRNLDNEYLEFDNETQKLLNKSFTSSVNDKITATIEFKDDNDESQSIKSGKEIIKQDETDEKELNDLEKDLLEEKEISFTKDVLPFVIPLTCILTMNDTNKDFVKMLSDIKDNPELLDIFDEQSLIWWNKKDLINIIKNIVDKFINKNSNTFNISINFKMGLKSLIDKPKELLELINECLKPKEVEKKKFGEVFTPIKTVNEMLDKLDEQYKKNNKGNSIFENKNLKWFDPANGMGNYPIIIYLRLMDGLIKEITNDKKRKKHILEKMIYMSEINKKNCYITKQIFDINDEYKLNLHYGDSLTIDIKKIFGIENFDVIIGNPPYNEKSNKRGELPPIYNKFIEYYVNKCTYLIFIIPSRWFSGGKGLDKFREMMLNRNDIVFIKHYNDAKLIFNQNVEIKGGVNYFLIDKNHNGDCMFNDNLIKLNSFDVLVDNKFTHLIQKLNKYESIINIFNGRYFSIETNSKLLNDDIKNIKCYISQNKGFIKYVKKNDIKQEYNYWKIITPTGCHKAYSGFGELYILKPDEIHSTSYVQFQIKNEKEAISLLSFLKCRLPNLMLSLRKNSQLVSKNTCKWIPLPPLNQEWNDEEIYKYFKLSKNDIKLINDTKINGYDNKIVKRSISKKIQKESDSEEEEKPKITKVKRNKSTVNK